MADPRTSTGGDVGSTVLDRPEARYALVVREVLEAELAAAVLHDDAWPVLATALEQRHQAGVGPRRLLRDVADQREMASAKHPAQILNFRLEHRMVTASDDVASSFPTRPGDAPVAQPRVPNRRGPRPFVSQRGA